MGDSDLNLKTDDTVVVPVIAEELQAGVRQVPTGGVRVHKHVTEREEVIDQPLRSEQVEVRRVVRNEVVPGPLPVRHEGDTLVVPVVKEVLKMVKQFVLTEELHITKRVFEERHAESVILRQEHAEIERIDSDGNSVESVAAIEAPVAASPPEATRRESVLGPGRRMLPVRKNKILRDD